MDSNRPEPTRHQVFWSTVAGLCGGGAIAWYLVAAQTNPPVPKWPAFVLVFFTLAALYWVFALIWDLPFLGTRRWVIAEAIEDALADLTGLLRNRSDLAPGAESDRLKHEDPCRHVHGPVDYQRETVVKFREGPRKPLALAVRRAVRWKWATTDDAEQVYIANTVSELWDVVYDISKIVRGMRGEPM